METVSFSRIVSSAESVSGAFDGGGGMRLWWRLVLWLHGKPISPVLNDVERRHILADGFRFYAQLYRFLGVLFWLIGGACWGVGAFENSREVLYWTLANALVGGFLWFASGLGFVGAKALRSGQGEARMVLCAFMVAVIAFLSGLSAALSVVMQGQSEVAPTLNLCALSVVWALGIGSYLIEVLYLVGEERLRAESP